MERDLLEELEQCIDIEKFCGLGKECYVEMASKFNDLSVFKKMGYEEEGKITFWGGLQEWQKELSAFVKSPDKWADKWAGKRDSRKKMKLKNRLEHTVFLYFFMVEYEVIKKGTNHKKLYQRMAESLDIASDFSLFSRIEDFVLFLALLWKWEVERFVQYLDEMQEICKKDASEKFLSDLDFQYEGKRKELTAKMLGELLQRQKNPDSKENVKETRRSVSEANSLSQKLEDDKNEKGPEKNEEGVGKSLWKWMEGHGEYMPILRTILNTEHRRRWYLYRIIHMMIEKQVDDLASDYALTEKGMKKMLNRLADRNLYNGGQYNEYVGKGEKGNETETVTMQVGSGMKSAFTMPASPILFIRRMEKADIPPIPKVVTPAFRRELLEECIVNMQGIFYALEMYFDIKEEHKEEAVTGIFESELNRCISLGIPPKSGKEKKYEEKKKEFIHRTEKYYNGGSRILSLQAGRELCWKILTGEGERSSVSRELLLLFLLLAKFYGVSFEDDYLGKHILGNSRFSPILDEENRFDAFFKETCDDIADCKTFVEKVDTISAAANAMEEYYLEQGIAPFQTISKGGRLE